MTMRRTATRVRTKNERASSIRPRGSIIRAEKEASQRLSISVPLMGSSLRRGQVGGRTSEEIPLAQTDAKAANRLAVRSRFDAFGDDLRADSFPDLQDRGDDFLLDEILVDALNEGKVDLEEFRPHFRYRLQAGIARSDVVNGDLESHAAQFLQAAAERLEVVDAAAFGDFQN